MAEYLPLFLFLILIIILLFGYPVAFTLGGVSVGFGLIVFGPEFFNLLPMRIFGTMTNFVLIAVPLFIYMGVMLERSGIAERLLDTMALLLGRLRGGLAMSVVIVGAILGASTGIVGATVTTMGLLSLPAMIKRGYKKELATGTIAASGTLGQLIPPSIVMVLLGSVMNISVGDLFTAAIIPASVLVTSYLIYIFIYALVNKKSVPLIDESELKEFKSSGFLIRVLRSFVLPLLLIVAVLGSIYLGVASPTEAAAVGALMASVLTALEGKLDLKTIFQVSKETCFITCMVFTILFGATAFGLVFRGIGGDNLLVSLIESSNLGPYGFLALVMIGIFIAGFFIDFIEIIFIFIPVVTPIFIVYDMDLLWIGILITMNLQTSFLTPPFGFSLFYLKGVSPPSIKTSMIYKGVFPFIIIQILAIFVLIAFPDITSYLLSLNK
ncbi:MAG: TRAP transporter large permease subunit [Bacteroidia bacterium]|nr:TRAP transporter large permease subunit [Bacteroidia bacterium]